MCKTLFACLLMVLILHTYAMCMVDKKADGSTHIYYGTDYNHFIVSKNGDVSVNGKLSVTGNTILNSGSIGTDPAVIINVSDSNPAHIKMYSTGGASGLSMEIGGRKGYGRIYGYNIMDQQVFKMDVSDRLTLGIPLEMNGKNIKLNSNYISRSGDNYGIAIDANDNVNIIKSATIGQVLQLTSITPTPSAVQGTIFNSSDNNHLWFYDGSAWKQLDN